MRAPLDEGMDRPYPMEREDQLDRLVADYADRLARGEDPGRDAALRAHPELREELLRCFKMIEAGIAPAPAAAARLAAGTRLGGYTLLRELGRGAMGVVYLAEDPRLGRRVALKVLRHHLTLEVRHVSRFEREARLAARLRHPHAVAIHEVGAEDGHHFIAMDYFPGPTLGQVIERLAKSREKPTPADLARATGDRDLERFANYPEAAASLLLPVCEALAAAHEAGLVHRDVKPSNILLDAKGSPCVADFGLAKGEGDIGLTFSGEPVGTPYYMAPEQVEASAKGADARTDVYALGITLYELLTLRRPFEAPSYPELVARILTWPAERLRAADPRISKGLDSVVLKAIAKDPGERYATVAELRDDLARAIAGQRPLAARARWFGRHPRQALRRSPGRTMSYPNPYAYGAEYRSPITLFGLPLVHIANGFDPRTGRLRTAVGILAIGQRAVGVVAVGGVSVGLFAFGGFAIGIAAAFGGAAVGGVAVGGAGFGLVALGGFACGYFAVGGASVGVLTLHDPEGRALLQAWLPSLYDAIFQRRGR